jgi:hypothetical protein
MSEFVKYNGKWVDSEIFNQKSKEELESMYEAKKNRQFYKAAKFRFNESLDHPKHNAYRWK